MANLHAGKWTLKWALQFWSPCDLIRSLAITHRGFEFRLYSSVLLCQGDMEVMVYSCSLFHFGLLMLGGIYWESRVPHNQGQEIIISYFPQNAFKLYLAYTIEVVTPSRKAHELFDPKKPRRNLFVCFLFTSQWWFWIFVLILTSGAKTRTQNIPSGWQMVCIATTQKHTLCCKLRYHNWSLYSW